MVCQLTGLRVLHMTHLSLPHATDAGLLLQLARLKQLTALAYLWCKNHFRDGAYRRVNLTQVSNCLEVSKQLPHSLCHSSLPAVRFVWVVLLYMLTKPASCNRCAYGLFRTMQGLLRCAAMCHMAPNVTLVVSVVLPQQHVACGCIDCCRSLRLAASSVAA